MAKKKLTKQQKRERRKRMASEWLATYNGTHVVRAYKKKFNVDVRCALRELEELGVSFTDEEKQNYLSGLDAYVKMPPQEEAFVEVAYDIDMEPYEYTFSYLYEDELTLMDVFSEPPSPDLMPKKRKKAKQGLPKSWKGHYCKVCQRRLANERFSGRGHRAHICKECSSKLKAERKAKRAQRESYLKEKQQQSNTLE